MEPIILGNNNESLIYNYSSPIVIPVEDLPVNNVIILRNPLLLGGGSSTITDTNWTRSALSGSLYPTTISDRVSIGGTSFVSSERLRVVGAINAYSYAIGTDLNISRHSSGSMLFTDNVVGTVSLSDLLSSASSMQAINVSIADTHYVFSSTNVENALYELYQLTTAASHVHGNLSLLETYDQTNSDISNAITASHAAVTLGTANGLSLAAGQILSMGLASTSTTGALSSTDWSLFNSKLDATNTLTALSSLVLESGALIVGTNTTTASILSPGADGQILSMSSGLPTWINYTAGGDTIFSSPTGYTATTDTVGAIPSGTAVSSLDGSTLLEILQAMLFSTPDNPIFINPTEDISITPGSSSMFTGSYVERGESTTMTITPTFTSLIGPGGNYYALTDGAVSYTLNASPFTNGASVTFTSGSYAFLASQPFKANGTGESSPEFVTLANGVTVYAENYTGYVAGNATDTITYNAVDPTFYGAFTAGTSTWNTLPTWTEIKAGCTKLLGNEPSSVNVTVTTYSGTVDVSKYIVIAFPSSYGTLTRILYTEGGNADVIGSFNTTTATYTRSDSTTVEYRIYYALNSYAGETVSRTLHYVVYF